jgi:V/A-type H+-transporting ATPase subunit E
MSEMTSGIGDLLQRLRKDGVEAGEAEKAHILDEANAKAKKIVADAEKKAQEIVDKANTDAEAKRKQLDAELSMAARDFSFRFAERVKKQVIDPVVNENVSKAVGDLGVLKDAMSALVGEKSNGATVAISPELQGKLEGFFTGELKKKLGGGDLEIKSEDGLEGFRLQKSGESFTWDVTGEAVAREFSALVEPVLKKYFQIEG